MTQGKKKKRAANRSIMLAKKIIIKDGGTVSWVPSRGVSGRISFLLPTRPSTVAPDCPTAPGGPVSRAPESFLSRPGLRPPGTSSRMEKAPASPAPAALPSGRRWRPCGLEPTRAAAAGRNRRRAPPPAAPLAFAASSAPSRPREAVAALWKRPAATLPSRMLLPGWHLALRPHWGPVMRSPPFSTPFGISASALGCVRCGKHCPKVGSAPHRPLSGLCRRTPGA